MRHQNSEMLVNNPAYGVEYNSKSLWEYHHIRSCALRKGAAQLIRYEWPVDLDWSGHRGFFALDRPDHAFAATSLDWGLNLSEPQITRALAHFLSQGNAEIRSLRLAAFLSAIGISVTAESLTDCSVQAENDRIDLKVTWPGNVVVIEAKFGHKVTEGQLKKYRTAARMNYPSHDIGYVLLALCPAARAPLKGRQRNIWTFCSWKQFFLMFERKRPHEDNPSLSIFLNCLWHRIDRMKA